MAGDYFPGLIAGHYVVVTETTRQEMIASRS